MNCPHKSGNTCALATELVRLHAGLELPVVTPANACETCRERHPDTPTLNKPGTVAASLAIAQASAQDAASGKVLTARLQKHLRVEKVRHVATVPDFGPGNEFKALTDSIKMEPKAGCTCEALRLRMNALGVAGCRADRDNLLNDLRENYNRYSRWEKFQAACRAVRTGLAFEIDPRDPIGSLFDEAVRRAEAKQSPPLEVSGLPRHLLMHIMPASDNDWWRRNVAELRKRIDLFDGFRSIAVVTGGKLDPVAAVREAFAGCRIDNWIIKPNDAHWRDAHTFNDLLDTVAGQPGVTFYCHAKGVTRHHDPIPEWIDWLWRLNLDDWPRVAAALHRHALAGAFRRYVEFKFPGSHRWHYSGTFYWLRNDQVFVRPDWREIKLRRGWWGEAWPGQFPPEQAACLFGDGVSDLYWESTWQQLRPLLAKHREAA